MSFYAFSRTLGRILVLVRALAATQAFRYSLIVDTSERGQECPFAKQAQRLARAEAQELGRILEQLRDECNAALNQLQSPDAGFWGDSGDHLSG